MLYSCFLKPSRNYLRGFLMAAWAGAKITERSEQRHIAIFNFSVDSKRFHQSSTALTFRNASVFGFIKHITHILHSFNSSLTALPSHGSLEDRQSP